jgi:hypothetical protein
MMDDDVFPETNRISYHFPFLSFVPVAVPPTDTPIPETHMGGDAAPERCSPAVCGFGDYLSKVAAKPTPAKTSPKRGVFDEI